MNTIQQASSALRELTLHELDAVGGGLCAFPHLESVTTSTTCSFWPPFHCTVEVTFNYAC